MSEREDRKEKNTAGGGAEENRADDNVEKNMDRGGAEENRADDNVEKNMAGGGAEENRADDNVEKNMAGSGAEENAAGGKGEFQSRYTKGQRIAAAVGAVLLFSLYIVTFISALTTSPAAPELFKACIGSSIFIPILLWGYIVLGRAFMKSDKPN